MNTKHLLLAATAAAFVALNFTGCKEKGEDEFDLSFENCVESVSSISINDGDTIRSKTIWPTNLVEYSSIKIKDGIKDVRGGCLLYAGTSKDKMKLFSDEKIDLQPFAIYYVESTPFIVHAGDTAFGEKQEIKFYSIPKHELVLTADYGDGEIAANIHWKLQYYYEEEDVRERGKTNHTYYDYEGTPSAVNVSLITSYDTTYNKAVLDFPTDTDSCYIKQGGAYGKPDYPAYIYRYWKDGKTIMYYDPVIYDFCFNLTVPFGEDNLSIKDTIRSILMDKNECVCDFDFNIYRTAKIGNKIWTIDDYRGSTRSATTGNILHGEVIDFYGYNEYLYSPFAGGYGDGKYIKGYHEANEDDWNDLMEYFAIKENKDTLELDYNSYLKIENADTAMNHYFTKGGAVQELFSSYGWTDSDGNLTETNQGIFNAVPKGGNSFGYHGKGKFAHFSCGKNTICFIVSKDYGGIAKCYTWRNCASIRYVKDYN
ncbi:MAG: hypothetical protein J6T12_01540 [Salinivirgaceae bacterium]|nr:hypothetical protein [Salinivirgaceae bacterium]